ncbi:hypothetical protein SmJEL517_g05721 [Synchytrium microbalum]|uniref:Arf-GAP domain-containing protein n=1 Tax=Synchytrium microbalum TaxID=1806994 RepID=A0A507BYB1_9FUNG|nr:uncharacterized protein SmJEL517_g05721 [Synchytrium microbalum]TPX30794.1 hypothetical protein SmJEL517_g05721 [Synchytrium microbalum]
MSFTVQAPRDDREKRRLDEKHLKILQELLKQECNQNCADCGQRGPRWASANIGCFLCIRCGGLHRKLGTHISKIKSITLDSWTPEQIQVMTEMGNQRVNAKYLANGANIIPPATSDSDMETLIRNKYERMAYMNSNGARAPVENNNAASADIARFAPHLQALAQMGFTDRERAMAALRAANGQLGPAAEMLANNRAATPLTNNRTGGSSSGQAAAPMAIARTGNGRVADPLLRSALEQLFSLGFTDEDLCLEAIRRANGNLEQAANLLLDVRRRRSSAGPQQHQIQQQLQQQQQLAQQQKVFGGQGARTQQQTINENDASFMIDPPGQNNRRGNRAQQLHNQHTGGNGGQQALRPQHTGGSTTSSNGGALLDLLGLDEPIAQPNYQQQQYQQQQQLLQQQYQQQLYQQQQLMQQQLQQQGFAQQQQTPFQQGGQQQQAQPFQQQQQTQAANQPRGNGKDNILALFNSAATPNGGAAVVQNGQLQQAGAFNPFAAAATSQQQQQGYNGAQAQPGFNGAAQQMPFGAQQPQQQQAFGGQQQPQQQVAAPNGAFGIPPQVSQTNIFAAQQQQQVQAQGQNNGFGQPQQQQASTFAATQQQQANGFGAQGQPQQPFGGQRPNPVAQTQPQQQQQPAVNPFANFQNAPNPFGANGAAAQSLPYGAVVQQQQQAAFGGQQTPGQYNNASNTAAQQQQQPQFGGQQPQQHSFGGQAGQFNGAGQQQQPGQNLANQQPGQNFATEQQGVRAFGQVATPAQNASSNYAYAPANPFGGNGGVQNSMANVPRGLPNGFNGQPVNALDLNGPSVFAPLMHGSQQQQGMQQHQQQQQPQQPNFARAMDANFKPGQNIAGYNGNPFSL